MDAKDREFVKRLKATFRGEAAEHIQALRSGLIELEKFPVQGENARLWETVYRESHSLKGAARAVNLKGIEALCQILENSFSALKRGSSASSPELYDLLHRSVDLIARFVASEDMEGSEEDRSASSALLEKPGEAARGSVPLARTADPAAAAEKPASPDPKTAAAPLPGTVRISLEKLDALLLQAEEMSALKIAIGQRSAESRELLRALQAETMESMRLKNRLPPLRESGWREWQDRMEIQRSSFENQLAILAGALEQDSRALKRMVDEHVEETRRLVMLPVSTLAEAFPKMVRDLARAKGKEIEVSMRGEELEIDKRVLEEMKDPMIHLLRNCVDHGMQTPQERAALGKAPCGRICLEFSAKGGGQVEILVSDDGAGIDPEKVRAAAVKAGVISRETAQTLDPDESLALIFQSGVSTSPIITDLSGRGLGLAIVREKAEKIGGTVSVETRIGAGAAFRLLLPLSLATFRGVILRVEGRFFVLPSIGIERVIRIDTSEIKSVENREIVRVEGRALPVARLAEVLGLPRREGPDPEAANEFSSASEREYLVVLASADKRIAFQADEIIEERQIIVKNLSKELQGLANVAGATILGNGSVVPVLSVSELLKSAALAPSRPAADHGKAAFKKSRILVAEDSITARMLLKNILETAGYAVTTAVDGSDAFFQAVNGAFDVVVSDVDMPRMSGFELCARIRSDARLSPLPVVLVTALESRDDRERGIEAGANAYIVKSAFDQGNLLEIVARLL